MSAAYYIQWSYDAAINHPCPNVNTALVITLKKTFQGGYFIDEEEAYHRNALVISLFSHRCDS